MAERERWLRRQLRHDVVIAFLALVSVGIGLYELARPRIDFRFSLLDAVDLAIVLVFIVDFVVHARESGDSWNYVKRHWWELPTLVPITGGIVEGLDAFALVRGLRLVRLVRVVRLLRVIGAATRLRRVRRYARRVADRARILELLMTGVLLVFSGAAAIFVLEPERPGLDGFGDALWWSLNLFTTVAYIPTMDLSAGGRFVAGALMVSGVAFLGVFTASLANAILKEPDPSPDDDAPEPVVD